ncbi:histidine triad (HIT) family protein [Microbulbifer donghaiensis]|uniref:Histidine triad (HIT) family protein n=1 Tax=Microbulbifer donghaiensis TaxID=494016 RepID=A0A1M5GC32_9GAMM|nr:histidine triad nucleotide-binding protein [Microbulbifer donghaiensis]SHG01350.1 histidine triad (HIT) family protein [Microbulbifer donghaiensis]
MSEPSVFSQIISGDIPVERVFEDEHCIVIRDRSPQAPTHLLIIPRKPLTNLADAEVEDKPLLGHLMWVAAELGRKLGLEGYRLVVNNGRSAGQTVFHLHIHLLAQKRMPEQGLAE